MAKAPKTKSNTALGSRKDATYFGVIKNLLSDRVGKTLSGLATACVGILGFYFSPLKDVVFHKFWKEDVAVSIYSNNQVREGDDFEVGLVLFPDSAIGYGDGELRLEFDPLLTRSDYNTTVISAGDKAYQAPIVHMHATASGELKLRAVFKTKYGEYSASKTVSIMDYQNSPSVSEKNFTGTWSMQFDNKMGKMVLLDHDGEIGGQYFINGVKQQAAINGIRDGSAFRVDLMRNETTKWYVDALWKKSGDYIEITGKVGLLVLHNDRWVPQGGQMPFWATAEIGSGAQRNSYNK